MSTSIPATLTPIQLQVLDLVSRGATNTAIAHRIGSTESGVKHHVHTALRALGARNRAHAVRIAIERGLLPVRPQHHHHRHAPRPGWPT